MLGPLRINAALVAKQILSLDAIAGGGRAVLGIGLGGRADDYEVSGVSMSERGAWQDRALAQIRRIFDGEGDLEAKIGPRPQSEGPSLIVGGSVAAAFDRAARYGDGWIMGGGRPDQLTAATGQLEAAWKKQGRDGAPRKMSLAYYSLGDDAQRDAERYLKRLLRVPRRGAERHDRRHAATDADTVRAYVAAFEAAGCDELIIFPASSDTNQVRLLADAIGL